MRVLLYTPAIYPKVDGIALRVRHHVRNLKNMGHQVVIACPNLETPDIYEGVQAVKLPAFVPMDYPESMISYPFPIVSIIRIFQQFQPDVVHFIGPEFVFIPFLFACKLFNIPLIGSYHFYVQAFLDRMTLPLRLLLQPVAWFEYSYNMADFVITPSRPMMQILHNRGMRCDDIWPPAVEADTFNPKFKSMEMRSLLTFGHPENPLLIYIGRVAKEKSMDIMTDILKVHKNAYLAVIGGGPDLPKWSRLHGAENRIFCSMEHWSGTRLSEAYASADVFVITSAFETLGNVVLEAMSSGVPVVGCNAGGIPHMLLDNVTGFLFEPDDSQALCEAVGKLITNDDLRKRLGEAGRKYCEKINWVTSSEHVVATYEKVIRQHGRLVPGVNAPALPKSEIPKGPIFVSPELNFRKGQAYYWWLPWLFSLLFAFVMIIYAQFGMVFLNH